MADNPDPLAAHHAPKEVTVKDATRAPIIYFDGCSTFGFNNGIVNLMLAVGLVLPTSDGNTRVEAVAAAHLRCSAATAMQLRDMIDKALLIAAPTMGEGKAN
jgi:hypothetical protein